MRIIGDVIVLAIPLVALALVIWSWREERRALLEAERLREDVTALATAIGRRDWNRQYPRLAEEHDDTEYQQRRWM